MSWAKEWKNGGTEEVAGEAGLGGAQESLKQECQLPRLQVQPPHHNTSLKLSTH